MSNTHPKGQVLIGLSGWSYPHWKDKFYAGVPQKRWLAHVAGQFPTVEVNVGYHRWLRRSAIDRWTSETPRGFRFSVKGPRTVTHRRRLNDVDDLITRQREIHRAFGPKLATMLWQFPGNFRKDEERFRRLAHFVETLAKRWGDTRHAVELRDESWFDDETARCLADHDVAAVQSDAAKWPLWDAVTTDLVYVRLHGHTRTYASPYRRASLESWARQARAWRRDGRDVSIYFDNDAEGAAPRDARRLMAMLDGAAAPPSR